MRTLRSIAIASIASTLLVAVTALAPAGAGDASASLEGEFSCNEDGTGTITWTLISNSDVALDIETQIMNIDGGPDLALDLQPNPLPGFDTATASVGTDGTDDGIATAEVEVTHPQGLFDVLFADVPLEPCEQPLEPTTTAAAEPVTPAARAEAVTRQPSFTG